MAYEFSKLSEVPVTDAPTNEANVLIEDGGEVKRTPKSAIGAQANWDETDETSPAFIMNKPTSMGGYKYYFYSGYYLYRVNSATESPVNVGADYAISQEAFEADYYSAPIMLNGLSMIPAPCAWYGDYSGVQYFGAKSLANTNTFVVKNINWGTAT